ALRGAGTLPVSARSAAPARGPEMRMTAMAAGPRPEERAKMVERSDIAAQVSAAEEGGSRGGGFRHGRACPGHPRLASVSRKERKTRLPAPSAGMTPRLARGTRKSRAQNQTGNIPSGDFNSHTTPSGS